MKPRQGNAVLGLQGRRRVTDSSAAVCTDLSDLAVD